jgi:cytochrome b pre-mRNA-processing protein 3
MRRWLRPDPARRGAEELYAAAVAQARRPEFYGRLGVPDTLDGRFELVALHLFLILRRLKAQPGSEPVGQALVDRFVEDMDESLRELGAGDLGVGRKVKAMGQALYGRIAAYEAGLEGPAGTLEAALRRNLFGTVQAPEPDAGVLEALAAYIRRESAAAGTATGWRFGPPPEGAGDASGSTPGR